MIDFKAVSLNFSRPKWSIEADYILQSIMFNLVGLLKTVSDSLIDKIETRSWAGSCDAALKCL